VGVLNPSTSETLIQPKHGEYFSVSRYREIKATFAAPRGLDSFKEVQLVIFDTEEKPLLIETAKVERPEAGAKPATQAAAPLPQGTDPNAVIQPGTDQ
jgi:hypothetical protein